MVTKDLCWIILLLLVGCRPQPKDEASYLAWLANPENGLNKVKQAEVFELSVQYLPAGYRAWQETNDQPAMTAAQKDSIQAVLGKSLYFILTIAPQEERASGDVFYSGVQDQDDFQQRVRTLNFGMAEYWQLRTEQGEFAPVLTNLENTYSLTDYRKLHLVFAPPDTTTRFLDAPQWDLVFNDEVFGTGIHHFVFFREDWEKTPEIPE